MLCLSPTRVALTVCLYDTGRCWGAKPGGRKPRLGYEWRRTARSRQDLGPLPEPSCMHSKAVPRLDAWFWAAYLMGHPLQWHLGGTAAASQRSSSAFRALHRRRGAVRPQTRRSMAAQGPPATLDRPRPEVDETEIACRQQRKRTRFPSPAGGGGAAIQGKMLVVGFGCSSTIHSTVRRW